MPSIYSLAIVCLVLMAFALGYAAGQESADAQRAKHEDESDAI